MLCFSIYPDTYTAVGENIAYGTSLSAEQVTILWEENDYLYSGQGHRRNMLETIFICVGIAGYEKDGNVYWVQAFGRK